MKTIQIKDISNKVLFKHTCKNNTIKITLELAIMEGVLLEKADLRNADLKNAYLYGANLINANLYNANLTNSILTNSILINSCLIRANLTNADLKNSDLINADLKNTEFNNTNIKNAILTSVNFKEAKGYRSFKSFYTSKRKVHCFKYESTWMIKDGLFWGSLEELEAKVLDTHKSKVYLMNIEYLKTLT